MLPQITDSEKKAAWLALESALRRAIKEGDERRLCELLSLLQTGERPLQIVLALPCFSGILHAAVESGSERCLLLLLEARADPNTVEETRDGHLRTPLFLALERNHLTKKSSSTLKMVRHLLAHGADTEGRHSSTGPQGHQTGSMTPLYYAADMGDLPSLTLLIQARAAVNYVAGSGGCTALMVAAEKGATRAVCNSCCSLRRTSTIKSLEDTPRCGWPRVMAAWG